MTGGRVVVSLMPRNPDDGNKEDGFPAVWQPVTETMAVLLRRTDAETVAMTSEWLERWRRIRFPTNGDCMMPMTNTRELQWRLSESRPGCALASTPPNLPLLSTSPETANKETEKGPLRGPAHQISPL